MRTRISIVAAMLAAGAVPAGAVAQDDAGTGGDAGDTFADATAVVPRGAYEGRLDPQDGDRHDYYRFTLAEGAHVSVLVTHDASTTDAIELLDPNGVPVDLGTRFSGLGVSAAQAFTHETGTVRLAVHRAHLAGEYRLHLAAERFPMGEYHLCFMNCEEPRQAPIDTIFGGSLKHTQTRVLLVPPWHGDLGDPFGPTVLDYIDATLEGIDMWRAAMDAFADDYPRYAYLRQIDVQVEVFDQQVPVDPAGYDVVIGYVAAGPAFRGVAASTYDPQGLFDSLGIGDDVHFSGRTIALSLFGSAPRAGQVMWDFPEVDDLRIVTAHEFGHTFGVGHTLWWDHTLGPDLMNSPAPFVYGNGFTVGDGGERTGDKCLSSLEMMAMAELYRWIPTGRWAPTFRSVALPDDVPYRWYC